MTYPEAPGYKELETSREAAEAIAAHATVLRARAYEILRRRPSTADEVAAELGESVLAVRPRISELHSAGQVFKSGERRENISGMMAHVWSAQVKQFKVGNVDLSQIECRILNTLAGQWDIVEKFRNGVDLYSELAAAFYNRTVSKETPAERGVGKQLELSCGYGAGAGTIVRTARAGTYGPAVHLTDAQGLQARDLYRTTHGFVTALWEKAGVILWALHMGKQMPWGPPGQTHPCLYVYDHRIFHVDTGLWLDYTSLERHRDDTGEEYWRHRVRDGWRKTYGARLVQNVVELLARQVIAGAAVRVVKLGYRVPLTVHDNIYTLIPANGGNSPEQQLETIRQEVRRPVPWLERCPIEADSELKDALA